MFSRLIARVRRVACTNPYLSNPYVDFLLSIRSDQQPVAINGNGLLFLRLTDRSGLPRTATGCNPGAPRRLHPLLSRVAAQLTIVPRSSLRRSAESPTSTDSGSSDHDIAPGREGLTEGDVSRRTYEEM